MKARQRTQFDRLAGARQRGQTLIFALITLVILSFVMFSVYDVQKITGTRIRAQNACDAAALAGARWQLSALNAIGELNLLKVTTAIIDMPLSPYAGPVPRWQWRELLFDIDNGLTQLQRRISVLGPWLGVFYGERAARMNGLENEPSFANELQQYARIYRSNPNYPSWVQQELASLVEAIVAEGVPARPWGTEDWNDLMSEVSVDGPTAITYELFRGSFYQAVASQDWCYLLRAGFYSGPPSYDCTYGSATTSWGLITFTNAAHILVPYLRLCVGPQVFDDPEEQLAGSLTAIGNLADQRNLDLNPNFPTYTGNTNYPQFSDPADPFYVPLRLYAYDPVFWNWNSRRPDDVNESVLMRSAFKPRFRYEGADSRWDVMPRTDLLTMPANPDRVSWTHAGAQGGLQSAFSVLGNFNGFFGVIPRRASAKAFGSIDDSTPPNGWPSGSIPIVLPVFTDVRLVPLAFSSGTARFDPLLWGHIRHLEPYTHYGTRAISSGCPYCAALILWENPQFRQMGTDWLKAVSQNGTVDPCPPPPPGGPGGGGGAGGINPY
ncbi:MAG: pilus assembly protein TadG-related protein [Verrucomicrobiae bacterium]|nr:pilus assembly protein TadG-related protein [Verrucomicrobiae bacterium]